MIACSIRIQAARLVADHEEALTGISRWTSVESCFEFDEVEDGESALRMLEAHRYDAVLTDISMPRVSFFFSSRRRHTRLQGDWSSDVCSSDLATAGSASTRLRQRSFLDGFRGIAYLAWNLPIRDSERPGEGSGGHHMASTSMNKGTAAGGGKSPTSQGLFTRQSSGLVRELGIPAATGIALASVAVVNTSINFYGGPPHLSPAHQVLPLPPAA